LGEALSRQIQRHLLVEDSARVVGQDAIEQILVDLPEQSRLVC